MSEIEFLGGGYFAVTNKLKAFAANTIWTSWFGFSNTLKCIKRWLEKNSSKTGKGCGKLN